MDLKVSVVYCQVGRRSLSENYSFATDYSRKAFELFTIFKIIKFLSYCPLPPLSAV